MPGSARRMKDEVSMGLGGPTGPTLAEGNFACQGRRGRKCGRPGNRTPPELIFPRERKGSRACCCAAPWPEEETGIRKMNPKPVG